MKEGGRRDRGDVTMALKMEEHRQPLEAEQGKETDSPPRDSSNQPCWHLDFSPRAISDFRPPEL